MEGLALNTQKSLGNAFAEWNLLSAMVCDPEGAVGVGSTLDKEAFCDPMLGDLFTAVVELHRAGKPVESATLGNHPALDSYQIHAIGDVLGQMYQANRPAEYAPEYVEIIGEAARRRQLAEAGERLVKSALHGPNEDSFDLLGKLSAEIEGLRGRYGGLDAHTLGAEDLIYAALDDAARRAENPGGTGIGWGIPSLDRMMRLEAGTLSTVGARVGMGKSTLLQCLALAAGRMGVPCLYFSTEMRGYKTMARILCNAASVDSRNWNRGLLTPQEIERLGVYRDSAHMLKLRINDRPDASPAFIYEVAQRVRDEWGGLGLVIVDYVQRLRPDTRHGDNKRVEVGETMRSLKNSALKMDIPFVTASQIGRASERRDDKRPGLSDLMESGDIEAESDNVVMVYRPEYYERKDSGVVESGTTEEAEIIIAKQREGPTGTVKVQFTPRYYRFSELPESIH